MARTLVGTFSANGPTLPIPINGTALVHVGPADGGNTFDSGVVALEVQAADSQWYASGIYISAADVRKVSTDFPKNIRLNLSGATAPDLDYVIESDRP